MICLIHFFCVLQCLDHHLNVQLIPVCANKSRQQRDSRTEARAGRVCVTDISRTGAEAECVPVNPPFGWEIAETGSGGLASQTRRQSELANGERGLLYPLIPRRQVGIVAAGKILEQWGGHTGFSGPQSSTTGGDPASTSSGTSQQQSISS